MIEAVNGMGRRAMRHHAESASSGPYGALIARSNICRDTTNFSFDKCYPCPWFSLLPIFPVATPPVLPENDEGKVMTH